MVTFLPNPLPPSPETSRQNFDITGFAAVGVWQNQGPIAGCRMLKITLLRQARSCGGPGGTWPLKWRVCVAGVFSGYPVPLITHYYYIPCFMKFFESYTLFHEIFESTCPFVREKMMGWWEATYFVPCSMTIEVKLLRYICFVPTSMGNCSIYNPLPWKVMTINPSTWSAHTHHFRGPSLDIYQGSLWEKKII